MLIHHCADRLAFGDVEKSNFFDTWHNNFFSNGNCSANTLIFFHLHLVDSPDIGVNIPQRTKVETAP